MNVVNNGLHLEFLGFDGVDDFLGCFLIGN